MGDGTTITTSALQQIFGHRHIGSTRKQMCRWGIAPVGRALNGEAKWPYKEVRARLQSRPGRGARTDLHPQADNPAREQTT